MCRPDAGPIPFPTHDRHMHKNKLSTLMTYRARGDLAETDLAHVERVVVPAHAHVLRHVVRVLRWLIFVIELWWLVHPGCAVQCMYTDQPTNKPTNTDLPGAGEAAVVEEDVPLAEHARLPVLFVLLDGVPRLLGRDLELPPRELGAVCLFVCLDLWGLGYGEMSMRSVFDPIIPTRT